MNRPRWQKVLSDLWSNRARSILVVASILVGLFAIGVIATLYALIFGDMRSGYFATQPANIVVNSGFYDKDFLRHVRDIQGVKQAEGSRTATVRAQTGPGEWAAIQLVSRPDLEKIEINQVKPLQGQWPPQERQIVIESTKLERLHAKLGNSITVELPSGNLRQLKITGVVQDQSLGAGGAGSGGFFVALPRGYVTQETLDWLEQPLPKKLNTIYVTVDGDSENRAFLEAVSTRLTDDLKKNGITVSSSTVRSSSDHPNRDLIDAISGVLLALGMMVVFLSGFLITNTLQALLEQQVQQVGIMKSVGARRYQVMTIYMVLILAFGVLAFLLSVPLSALVAARLLDFLALNLNFSSQGQQIVPAVVGLQAFLALFIPQVAAFLPIWTGTGISVQEALSGIRQNHMPSRDWLDKRLAKLKSFSRPVRIAIRNTFRRKGRLVLTLVTLTTGGAIFIGTFGVQVSMQKYIHQIGRYFLADVNVTLNRPYRNDEIKNVLQTIPNVGYIEAWSSARSQVLLQHDIVGEDVQLLAPPADSPLVEPVLIKGRWLEPGDQNAIVLNELFLTRYPELSVGDPLRLQVNGKETDWEVVGFFRFAGKVTGFLAYTNYSYLTQLNGQTHQAVLFRVVSKTPNATRSDQLALAKAIEECLRKNNISVGDVTTGASLVEKSSGGFGILTSFLLFLAGLIALVGSIGLAGTMSMNVMERTREIGVLRAIGATNQVLMKMVIVEGMLIGIISWILASVLSFPIGKLLSDSITQAVFGASSQLGYTLNGFLIWLGVVILLSILASVMPARRAASLTIREVLSYE